MSYTISYFSEAVEAEILALPATLQTRYITLTRRMVEVGANLGEPHAEPMGDGLFELRLKGAEGIARVFYCVLVGRRIVMLHSLVKKAPKTPLRVAQARMKGINNANP